MKRRPSAGNPLVYGLAIVSATALCLAAPRAAHAQFTFIGPKQSFAPYHFFPAGAGGDTLIQTEFPGTAIAERDHIVGFSSVKNIDDINAVHDMFLNPSSPTLNFIPNPLTMGFGRIFRNTLVFNESVLNIIAGGIVADPSVRSEFSGVLRTYDMSTVNLAAIGEIPSFYAFDHSKLNMTGGRIDGLLVKENATATIDGGAINVISAGTIQDEHLFGDLMEVGSASVTIKSGAFKSLGASLGGFVTMTGGTLSGSATATGDGEMAFSNVNVPSVQARENSQIFVSGGQVGGANVVDGAGLFLTGTQVTGAVVVNGNDASAATITGGSVGGAVSVLQKSSAFLSNVAVRTATSFGNSTLQIQAGTAVAGDVVAIENGAVKVLGGVIAGHLTASKNASVNLAGGTVISNLISIGNGKIDLDSGVVHGRIFVSGLGASEPGATGDQSVSVGGGQISGAVEISGSRSFNLEGGIVPSIKALGVPDGAKPTVNITNNGTVLGTVDIDAVNFFMSGGVIGEDLLPGLGSSVFFLAGRIGKNLSAVQPGTIVRLSGGQVDANLIARNFAQVIMTGGRVINEAVIETGAKLTWTGGTIKGESPPPAPLKLDDLAAAIIPDEPQKAILPAIRVSDGGELDIVGFDLAATLVDPNFEGMFSLYELAGRLADGTNIGGQTFLVQNGTGASFQLRAVPETTSAALAGVALAALAAARRPGARRGRSLRAALHVAGNDAALHKKSLVGGVSDADFARQRNRMWFGKPRSRSETRSHRNFCAKP